MSDEHLFELARAAREAAQRLSDALEAPAACSTPSYVRRELRPYAAGAAANLRTVATELEAFAPPAAADGLLMEGG